MSNTEQSTQDAIDNLDNLEETMHLRSDAEIERLINETEDTLQALMQELKRRQQDGLHKNVNELEEHLENADTSFQALRKFIAMALQEIRSGSRS